jgi:hypothetical protein
VFSDPTWPLFVSFLSLFTGLMLLLVTADNLVVMLVGWEGIGVCSYVLIGFWFTRLSATKSALKAVLVNRVGDGMLMWAILAVWWYAGNVSLLPSCFFPACIAWLSSELAFILGAMGKSAQIGFHVWLADAMEGPTPVSALIHAATLVTAGLYVLTVACGHFYTPLSYSPLVVGCLTLIMAAAIGLGQSCVTCETLGRLPHRLARQRGRRHVHQPAVRCPLRPAAVGLGATGGHHVGHARGVFDQLNWLRSTLTVRIGIVDRTPMAKAPVCLVSAEAINSSVDSSWVKRAR